MAGPYPIAVAGESFDNADGTSRQAEIARCCRGQSVSLEREPLNRYDSNCIKVLSCWGIQIGNTGRQYAEWMAEVIDRGDYCEGVILDANQAPRGLIGVTLLVSLDPGETPAECLAKFEASDYPWLEWLFIQCNRTT